ARRLFPLVGGLDCDIENGKVRPLIIRALPYSMPLDQQNATKPQSPEQQASDWSGRLMMLIVSRMKYTKVEHRAGGTFYEGNVQEMLERLNWFLEEVAPPEVPILAAAPLLLHNESHITAHIEHGPFTEADLRK